MDVCLKYRRRDALQVEREVPAALAPQPVRKAMSLHRMETFKIQHGLDEAVGRGIAVEGGHDVSAEGMRDRGIAQERFGKGFVDQLRRHFRPMQPLAHALDDSSLERVVA